MKQKTAQGFTLIELLIVIAVLGILAIAVLSAIDPIEQINRSKDTGSRSDAEQLISGIDRFYASRGFYPWQTGASSTNTAIDTLTSITASDQEFGADDEPMLENLSEEGSQELKESFINRITDSNYNYLYIYNGGDQGDSTYVCFVPKSGSFIKTAGDRCNGEDGTIPDDLGNATVCGVTIDGKVVDFSCLP